MIQKVALVSDPARIMRCGQRPGLQIRKDGAAHPPSWGRVGQVPARNGYHLIPAGQQH